MKMPPQSSEEIKRARLGVTLSKKELMEHRHSLAELDRADRKAIAEKAKAAGLKAKQIRADDGSLGEVYCFPSSYHLMGFQDHQTAAAERFSTDWEVAYRVLRGQQYEAGVDGARNIHGPHFAQVNAQTRLQAVRSHLGERGWSIIKAIVIHGATIRELMVIANCDNRRIRQDIDCAFNDLHGFYSGNRIQDKIWAAFESLNAERAAMISEAERGV